MAACEQVKGREVVQLVVNEEKHCCFRNVVTNDQIVLLSRQECSRRNTARKEFEEKFGSVLKTAYASFTNDQIVLSEKKPHIVTLQGKKSIFGTL